MASGIIWTPEERTRQPRTPARAQQGVALANGLGSLFAFSADGIADIVGASGRQAASNFVRYETRHGTGFGRTAYGFSQPAVASPFGTGPFSAVVFAAPTSAAAITPFFSWRDDGGGEQCSFAINTDAGFTPSAGSVTMTTATGLVLEAPGSLTGVASVYGFSVTSTSSGVIYVDGVAKTTNAYNSGLLTTPPRPFYIASHLGSVSVHSEPIYLIATWKRTLSAAEHAAIARNVWALFEADNDPVFYSLGGGGATIAASTGAAVASGYAGNFASPITVASAAGAAGSAGLTATVSSAITVACSVGAAGADDYPANVASAITVLGGVGAAVGTGLSASVSSGTTISATAGAAVGAGLAADVSSPITVSAAVGAATAAGLSAGISTGNEIAASTGAAVGAGLAAGVSSPIAVAGSVGAATASGPQASIGIGSTIPTGIGAAVALGLGAAVTATNQIVMGVGPAFAAGLKAAVVNVGELSIEMPRTRRLGGSVASRTYRLGGAVAGRRHRLGGPTTKE